jgi:hypothetical protein
MNSKIDGATDVSDESEPSEATEQTKSTEQNISFAEELLSDAKAEGIDIGDAKLPEATAETKAEPENKTEESEPDTEEKAEPEQQPAEPETDDKSIEGQIAAHKARGEKVPWYLKRISEESGKRKERTEDLRKEEARRRDAEAEVQRLQGIVAQSSVPAPTAQNPMADIYDEPGLQRLEGTYEKILEFAEKNRDGAENVIVGKDKDGNEIRKDFTPDEIADMRYKADKALRKDIPQRRGYLVARAQADAAAVEIYPEFKDPEAPLTKEAISILRAAPQLETVLGPEVLLWIGHALKGRQQYMTRNGKTNGQKPAATTAADKIEKASQTRLAPTATQSRAFIERRGADMTSAQKQLEEKGDDESAKAFLDGVFSQRKGTVKKTVA